MVPSEPREALAVGAELRRGVEVIPRSHRDRFALSVPIKRNERVDCLRRAGRMVFADGEDSSSRRVDEQVCVANVNRWGDWRRIGIIFLSINALVIEVREPDSAVAHRIVAATVFMNAGSRIEACRGDIGIRLTPPSDYDLVARLSRPQLVPVKIVVIPPHLAPSKRYRATEEKVDGDR